MDRTDSTESILDPRKTCTGLGPGHGRTGGWHSLPMGDFAAGGFERVSLNSARTFDGGQPGCVELSIGGRREVAWHCDPGYLMIYRMLMRVEPVYFHAETSLLACGAPEKRRFLSISFEEPGPCERTGGL